MDEPASTFRVVLRGYEPAQVNRRVEELTAAVAQATAQRDALAARLEAADRERAEESPSADAEPTFEQLGSRIGQMLALAAEEADDLRRAAGAEIAAERGRLEEETARTSEEADRYAAATRSAAETEAARIVEDARREADRRLDEAEREASARIQEADAVLDEQRTKALQSAADFESTLGARRKAAEEEFQRQMGEVERQADEARQFLDKARTEAETTETEARRHAEQVVREAEERARSIVDEAETAASRLRAESDRELTAASQRRDSINAQLANVRQMLTTLTGSVTPAGAAGAERPTDEDQTADDGSGVDAR